MSGYTRNDTSNNIANDKIINAADLDGEFNAVESAFDSSTGHTHDGSTAEGAPITKIGPIQDVVATATTLEPKINATVDLGTATKGFKDGYFTGELKVDNTTLADSIGLSTLGHRNKIINGQFTIDQRGDGATGYTADGYTLDRWTLTNGTGASNEIERAEFTPGQTAVPGNPRYYAVWKRPTAGTGPSTWRQKIEGARTFAGKTCTLTVWLESTAATEITPILIQRFGTGGSPSLPNIFTGAEQSITAGFTKISLTFDLNSVSGETFGTNDDDALEVVLQRQHDSTNATTEVLIANVSLVEGDATAEEDPGAWRSETSELRECQRYYRKSDGRELGVTFNAPSSGDFFYATESYPDMRIVPSVVLDSSAGAEINLNSISATDISKTSFRYTGQSSSSGRTGWIGGYTANAEL